MEMKKYKLNECTDILAGGTPSTKNEKYWNGNIPWLSVKDFGSVNKIVSETEKNITLEGFNNCPSNMLHKGDLILSARGTVGKIAMVDKDMAFNQSCFGIRTKNNICNSDFIFYWYLNNQKIFKGAQQGNVFKSVTLDFFEKTEANLPSLKIQQKIAAVLSSLDDKIALNNRINAKLEQMAKRLYDYWFVQFDFPGADGKPYKSNGGKMVWNEELKREIPEGWEVKNLYRIADYVNGLACQNYRPKDNEDSLPVIKIKEMNEGISNDTEKVSINIPEKYKINNGDILFSWSATLEVLIWNQGNGGLNQHIFKVIPKEYFSKEFVYLQLDKYIVNFQKQAEARKTTMGHITSEHINQSRIVLPPKDIIKMFTKKISGIYSQKGILEQENLKLTSMRDKLLPLLMNGQIVVE